MGKKELTARQQQILEFIQQFDEERSYPPTIRDIQQACSISSTSVVDYNLHILEREGYIHRDREVSRGIEVLGGSRDASAGTRVSVLGYIAAGEPLPMPTQESWGATEPVDVLDLPQGFLGNAKDVYALRVKGTSMIDAYVTDGDLVLLESIPQPENGDMVAAWLTDREEVTLKHFYLEGDKVRLQPANSNMEPITVPAESVAVRGRVVGVIRTL